MRWLLAFLIALPLAASAQQNQCRTSPVGTSTSYCSSEAFATAAAAAAAAALLPIDLGSGVTGILPNANGGLGNAAGAWTVYAPTPAPNGTTVFGATSGSFYAIGKLVHFTVTIPVTTAGTGSGGISVPLPIGSAKRAGTAVCGDVTNTGTTAVARISGSSMVIVRYDAGSMIVNGETIVCTGIYEQS